MIKVYYRDRKTGDYYQKSIQLCQRQIELSPRSRAAFLKKHSKQPLPSHVGYEQLAIILDKERRWAEAIKLCRKARSEGWGGDWDKRIARYESKVAKI